MPAPAIHIVNPIRVVVATISLFGHRGAAELAPPDDERLVEQAAPLEILEQPSHGQIHRPTVFGVILFDVVVGVPLRPRPPL